MNKSTITKALNSLKFDPNAAGPIKVMLDAAIDEGYYLGRARELLATPDGLDQAIQLLVFAKCKREEAVVIPKSKAKVKLVKNRSYWELKATKFQIEGAHMMTDADLEKAVTQYQQAAKKGKPAV